MTLPVWLRNGGGEPRPESGCSDGGAAGVGRSLTDGAGVGVGGAEAAAAGRCCSRGGAGSGAWAAGASGVAGSTGAGRGGGVGAERTTRCGTGAGSVGNGDGVTAGAAGWGVAPFDVGRTLVMVGFASGFASSTGAACLRRPSESARRRTRSARGSSMLDEWLLTPIFSRSHRSSTT
jgi:hypothetical protein